MTTEIIQRIATRAVIIKDGKVLIIREASTYKDHNNIGKYDFPGGRVEIGEKINDALLREVKEECGLDVEIGQPFFVGEWRPIVHNQQLQIIGIYFKCAPKNDQVVLSQDHDDFKWIDPRDYQNYNLMIPHPEALKTLILDL